MFFFSVSLWLVVFEWCFANFFVCVLAFSLPDMFQKNSLDVRFFFLGSFSLSLVLLHRRVARVFFVFSER